MEGGWSSKKNLCQQTWLVTTFPEISISLSTLHPHLIPVVIIIFASTHLLDKACKEGKIDTTAAMSKLSSYSYLAKDNLPTWFPLHHFNEPSYNYATGLDLFDPRQSSLWAFVGMVVLNPVFWNTVAQNGWCPPLLAVPYHIQAQDNE